jgi:hypothetical protein
MFGDVTLIILIAIRNTMNPINYQNPAFASLLPKTSLLFRIKIAETENNTIAGYKHRSIGKFKGRK